MLVSMQSARISVIGAATIAMIADLGMVYCVVPFPATEEDELGSAVDFIDAVLVAV
jgi:hypothetical protein